MQLVRLPASPFPLWNSHSDRFYLRQYSTHRLTCDKCRLPYQNAHLLAIWWRFIFLPPEMKYLRATFDLLCACCSSFSVLSSKLGISHRQSNTYRLVKIGWSANWGRFISTKLHICVGETMEDLFAVVRMNNWDARELEKLIIHWTY